MDIRRITVAGAGVLGSQIATQCAFKGYDVTVYEVEEGIERARDLLDHFHEVYLERLAILREKPYMHWRGLFDERGTSVEEIDAAQARFNAACERMRVSTSPEEAFSDADLVIEAVPERESIKIPFYEMMAPYLPEHTIIGTNTSTLLPSTFAAYTGCPERYLAMHFSNAIWSANTLEIMAHPAGDGFAATDPEVVEQIREFAPTIGMIPVVMQKEHAQYILNSLLGPLLTAALELWADGVATIEDIDLVWSHGGGATNGPFHCMDTVGLNTQYNVLDAMPRSHDPEDLLYVARERFEAMIAEGRLGFNAGKGFYDYE